jgi:hypothetical protein
LTRDGDAKSLGSRGIPFRWLGLHSLLGEGCRNPLFSEGVLTRRAPNFAVCPLSISRQLAQPT